MKDEVFPRIVEQAGMAPGQCLFSGDQEGPFIDTGVTAPWVRPYVYLSAKAVESIARDLLDMVPRSEFEAKVEQMEGQLAAYAERVQQLEAGIQAMEMLEELAPAVQGAN